MRIGSRVLSAAPRNHKPQERSLGAADCRPESIQGSPTVSSCYSPAAPPGEANAHPLQRLQPEGVTLLAEVTPLALGPK